MPIETHPYQPKDTETIILSSTHECQSTSGPHSSIERHQNETINSGSSFFSATNLAQLASELIKQPSDEQEKLLELLRIISKQSQISQNIEEIAEEYTPFQKENTPQQRMTAEETTNSVSHVSG